MLADLPQRLAERLKQPLPGWRAQARYQPEMSCGRYFAPPPSSARAAAVLALVYPTADGWHVPLTLRPAHMADHANQISLPGGLIEPNERSSDAALRELAEELGVPVASVELLGELSDIYLFRSNFVVSPCVAAVKETPHWRPSPMEVQELLEVPLAHLLDPASVTTREHHSRGLTFTAPGFEWRGHHIWGATSLIVGELVEIVTDCYVV